MEAALRGRRSDPASEVKGRGYRRPAAGNSSLTSRGKLPKTLPLQASQLSPMVSESTDLLPAEPTALLAVFPGG
eukprot:COSAG06_NODE_6839_length_2751_cov_47.338612_1_plen_73_part_10